MNILFADDDPVMQRILAEQLKDAGHQVAVVGDGYEALERFQSEPFQLVITDWQMPAMDGLELVRQIRKVPGRDRTYVILITGKELDGLRADIFSGVDDLITKPFDWRDFERRLQRVEEQIIRIQQEPEAAAEPSVQPDFSHLNRLSGELRQAMRPARSFRGEGIECNWQIGPHCPEYGQTQNFFELSDFLGFYMADIAGEPITVDMTGALLHQLLGAAALAERYPEGKLIPVSVKQDLLLRQSALRLSGGAGGMDILPRLRGLTLGLMHRESREMQYMIAGRNSMSYLSGSGRFSIAPSPGAESCSPEQLESVYHIPFQSGDRAFFFTEGLTKAAGKSRIASGQERIFQTLQELPELPLTESARELLARFAALPESDDPGAAGVSLLSIGIE